MGGSYVDANFGASVKVITGPGVYHTYSANNPLSAYNTYVMTYRTSGTFDVVLAATGKVAFSRVNANQDFFWDSLDDSVYYYPTATAFMKHDLPTCTCIFPEAQLTTFINDPCFRVQNKGRGVKIYFYAVAIGNNICIQVCLTHSLVCCCRYFYS